MRPGAVAALILGVVLLFASLAGCTVPVTGLLALSRAQDRTIRADVWMCSGHTNVVEVYINDSHKREWALPTAVTSTGSVTLEGLEEWLVPGQEYNSFVGSDDNQHSAAGPEFTAAEIAALQPGQSLMGDAAAGPAAPVPTDQFEAHAKQWCQSM